MLQRTDESDAFAPVSRWAVVNTHPNKERFAIENLQRQSFHAYCPMMRRRIRHARRSQDVLRPMFQGYVFVEITPVTQWRLIMSTYGVRSLVRAGTKLGFLPDGMVESLLEREVDGAISKPEQPFEIGQEVTKQGGPFDGLVATILELNDRERVTVLMDILNQSVRVKVPTQSLV